MKNYEDLMITKYKNFAVIYDNVFKFLEWIVFLNKEKNPRLALLNKIPDEKLCILDVCCGTGNEAIPVAGITNTVVGIDLSPEMISRAREKIVKRTLPNISFFTMNALHMKFPDKNFDIAMSWFALHEMDYDMILAALLETGRVLKSGGRLFIVDYENDKNRIRQFLFRIYLKICYPKKINGFFNYNWEQILKINGFKIETIENYTISKLISAIKI